MTISNELLSSTLYSIRDGAVDELYQKVAFLDGARKHGGIETEDGGIKIQRPLALAEHSTITSLPTGYEAVSLAVNGVMTPAAYEWSDFVAPIVISKREELENSGEKAIVKIVETRMKAVMGMLRRELNRQILVGNSTVLTDFNTLNGHSASGIGFLEADSVATQRLTGTTVGGVAKVGLTAPGWANQAVDINNVFGTDGIRLMQEAYLRGNAVAPMGETDLLILSEAAMANYRRALFAQERYVDEKVLDGGRMQLAFAGAAVELDSVMGFNATSTDFGAGQVSGYMINFDGIKLAFHKDADFALSPFEHVNGTTTRAAQLYVKGQLIADHLGSQSVLFNGETY